MDQMMEILTPSLCASAMSSLGMMVKATPWNSGPLSRASSSILACRGGPGGDGKEGGVS